MPPFLFTSQELRHKGHAKDFTVFYCVYCNYSFFVVVGSFFVYIICHNLKCNFIEPPAA